MYMWKIVFFRNLVLGIEFNWMVDFVVILGVFYVVKFMFENSKDVFYLIFLFVFM